MSAGLAVGAFGFEYKRTFKNFESDMQKGTHSKTNQTGFRYYTLSDLNGAKGFFQSIGAWLIKTFGTEVTINGQDCIIGKRSFKEFITRLSPHVPEKAIVSLATDPALQRTGIPCSFTEKIDALAGRVLNPLKEFSVKDSLFVLNVLRNQGFHNAVSLDKPSNLSLPPNITKYLSQFNAASYIHTDLSIDIEAKQKEVEEKKLPFKFLTPIGPSEPAINTEKLSQFYDSLKPEYVKVAKYLIEKLTIIDYVTFVELIKTNCKQLDAALKGEDYTVAMADGKSQSWVANIACRFLSKLPVSTASVCVKDTKDIANLFAKPCKNIVRFDDGIYSGMQIGTFMAAALDYCIDNYKTPTEPINCYLVIGYMTEKAQKHLETTIEAYHKEYPHLVFHIICNKKIESSKTLFAKDEVGADFENKAAALYGASPSRNPIITTEWKLPDDFSTALGFFRGLCDPKVFRDPKAARIQFIPNPKKPY